MKQLQITFAALLILFVVVASSCTKKNGPAPGNHQQHSCDHQEQSTGKSST